MSTRHFLTLMDCSASELKALTNRAIELKAEWRAGKISKCAENKVMAMIFEKSSTRTRVSFQAGMEQLGGGTILLSPGDTQIGRGEPIKDTSRVVSSMVDLVMIRTFEHSKIEEFAAHSQVPVINALTDDYHPCQLLADMQAFQEHRGDISGKSVAWVGDGNNMCHSYINAAKQWDFELRIASPEGYDPNEELVGQNADRVSVLRSAKEAVKGVDLVVTDTWASMGQEQEKKAREDAFGQYQVNMELMALANDNAAFMHCLPAYRGLEVTEDVMEDKNISLVWDEAENRLHAQKALIELLLGC